MSTILRIFSSQAGIDLNVHLFYSNINIRKGSFKVSITIRKFKNEDVPAMVSVWNEVVKEGNAFPQTDMLTVDSGRAFFASQSLTAVAEENGVIIGLYILHPNNIGRCGHLANASYAVASYARGRGVGERLVRHCLENAADYGFKILQFNAVVASNAAGIALYEKLGFVRLGTVPGGFLNGNNEYEDIILFYHTL